MHNPINQFREAMLSAGLTPPIDIEADGKLKRFSSSGKTDKNGWYVLFPDGIPAGSFGCWQKGFSENWRANLGRKLSDSEISAINAKMESAKSQREAEKSSLQADAKARAMRFWERATPASDHPYLIKKGIKAYGAKQDKEYLYVPLLEGGEIQSLQVIESNGAKRFLTGGKVKGCYFLIGNPEASTTLCICEGYATGASIHEATGYPVVIAFNAGNLEAVARVMKSTYPKIKIIVCGDDDWKSEGNVGVVRATECANSIDGLLAFPIFKADRKEGETDFNDMAQVHGLEAVKQAIDKATAIDGASLWDEPMPLPTQPDVQSFDMDLLPDSLRAWVKDVADLMQSPPDYTAVGVIVALSSLIGAKAVIQPKGDWQVTANLWGMLVGLPSAKKSPALKKVLEMMGDLQSLENNNYQQKAKEWEVDLQVAELVKRDKDRKAQTQIKDDHSQKNLDAIRQDLMGYEPPVKPPLREYVVYDATVAKLGEILSGYSWGTLAYRDELIGLLLSLDKEGEQEAKGFYLTAYSGDQPYIVNRIGRGRIAIDRVCLSLLGSIQPDRLRDYFHGGINGGSGNDGLLQRFGLAVFPDLTKEFVYVDRAPDLVAADKVKQIFRRLSELEPDGDRPRVWRFTTEAQAIFIEWYVGLETELRSGELHPTIESHLGKYFKLIPALALIFAHVEVSDQNCLIGQTELLRAIAFGEYLRSHANRIYQNSTMPEANGAGVILRRIKSGVLKDGFTAREVAQKNWQGLNDVKAVRSASALLEDFGYLRLETVLPTAKGGRASERYRVNPRLLKGGKND